MLTEEKPPSAIAARLCPRSRLLSLVGMPKYHAAVAQKTMGTSPAKRDHPRRRARLAETDHILMVSATLSLKRSLRRRRGNETTASAKQTWTDDPVENRSGNRVGRVGPAVNKHYASIIAMATTYETTRPNHLPKTIKQSPNRYFKISNI
jgi:hypothetical protein